MSRMAIEPLYRFLPKCSVKLFNVELCIFKTTVSTTYYCPSMLHGAQSLICSCFLRLQRFLSRSRDLKSYPSYFFMPCLCWHCLMHHFLTQSNHGKLQDEIITSFSMISEMMGCTFLLAISKRFELERWDCARIVGLFKQFTNSPSFLF